MRNFGKPLYLGLLGLHQRVQRLGAVQKDGAATRDDALSDGGTRGVQRVRHTVLLLANLNLAGTADLGKQGRGWIRTRVSDSNEGKHTQWPTPPSPEHSFRIATPPDSLPRRSCSFSFSYSDLVCHQVTQARQADAVNKQPLPKAR